MTAHAERYAILLFIHPVHEFVSRPGHEFESVGSKLLFLLLCRQFFIQLQHGISNAHLTVYDGAWSHTSLAPINGHVSRYGTQADPGLFSPYGIQTNLIARHAPIQDGGLVGCIHPR